jgi:hypothetical protein
LVVIVVLWLASTWLVIEPLLRVVPGSTRALHAVALATTIVVVIANFTLFHRVNLLVQYIHMVPYSSEAMFTRLRALAPQLSASDGSTDPVVVDFERQSDRISDVYDATLRALFGSDWQSTTFYRLFRSIKETPIMRDENLPHLVHAFYPRATFVVQIYNGPRRVTPLDAQVPAVAEAVYDTAASDHLTPDLRDDRLILDTRTGTLTRDHKGEYVDVFTGVEGQRLTVRNVGAWDAQARQLTGLPAELRAGTWHLLAKPTSVLTAPFDLTSGSPDGLPTGFSLSPGPTGVSLTRLSDKDGAFLRVIANQSFANLIVVTTGPLPAPDGAPLTVHAQIRYHEANGAQIHLQQINDRGVPTASTTRATHPDRWLSLAAISTTPSPPTEQDLFFAGVLDVRPGGYFDLRDFGVSAGIFPQAELVR